MTCGPAGNKKFSMESGNSENTHRVAHLPYSPSRNRPILHMVIKAVKQKVLTWFTCRKQGY